MKRYGIRTVITRSLGTVVLLFGCVLFMARAPFLHDNTQAATHQQRPPLRSPPATAALLDPGAMTTPVLPELGPPGASAMLQPSFGLFEANFAATDDQPGFHTAEHPMAGNCTAAGERYFAATCPGCELIGGSEAQSAEMLLWNQTVDGREVLRAASRNCTGTSATGLAIVGTLDFDTSPVNLGDSTKPVDTHRVPLLAGALRITSITLGDWSATYDQVARPSSALPDMASALQKRGWREVSDPELLGQGAFQGQRVFTNETNWLCMISLTKQGDNFQLLTIINSRA
ncbi:MAG TPA: hypothetical protein PKK10_02490 [Woeseiaceae bacterium]|nr:hypothetical protein [Woeseiaceae bacterium]